MRYVINDDDFEDWYRLLYELNLNMKDHTLDYILDEMKKEILNVIPIANQETFLALLEKRK